MAVKTRSILLFLVLIHLCFGREQFRQQGYNQNTDFLSHEISGNPSQPKRDYVAPQSTLTSTLPENKLQIPNSNPWQNNGNINQANSVTTASKRDYVNPQYPAQKTPAATNSGNQNTGGQGNKRDYVNPGNQNSGLPNTASVGAFPPLNGGQGNKRDYVNPGNQNSGTPNIASTGAFPPLNGGQGNKRDYVNPGNQNSDLPNTGSTGTHNNAFPPLNGEQGNKRDYVNTKFPTPNIEPGNNGNPQNKVKDLVNFYDNKAGTSSTTAKAPSFSSILTGTTGTNKNPTPSPTGNKPAGQTDKPNKPLSFSDAVSGSNKPNVPSNVPSNLPKNPSSTQNKFSTVQPGTNPPRTGPVLPSTIVQNQNNKNPANTNSNEVSDLELQTLSEELLRKDTNNAAKYVTVNYQEKTTSQSKEDKASQPLFTVAEDVWNIPTIKKFVPLLDNYERDTLVNEYVTPQERNEENAFMDVIMTTNVIRHLMIFLKEKGYVTPDPKQQRDFLKQLWFSLYSRGKGKISSSGFEHIFVSELKNGEVSGLHNWIYFSKEERANRVNYLGYLKYLQLSDKGAVLKLHFNQNDVDKPVNSMFVGTSPELEMAVYTLCFVTRADRDCSLKLAGKNVDIVTHTFRYRSKNLIGSAYPQI